VRPLALTVAPDGNALLTTVPDTVTIEEVGTSLRIALPSTGSTRNNQNLPFTRKVLANPVRVNSGQTVTVQVTFTFS